jgi:hypothetical protein
MTEFTKVFDEEMLNEFTLWNVELPGKTDEMLWYYRPTAKNGVDEQVTLHAQRQVEKAAKITELTAFYDNPENHINEISFFPEPPEVEEL